MILNNMTSFWRWICQRVLSEQSMAVFVLVAMGMVLFGPAVQRTAYRTGKEIAANDLPRSYDSDERRNQNHDLDNTNSLGNNVRNWRNKIRRSLLGRLSNSSKATTTKGPGAIATDRAPSFSSSLIKGDNFTLKPHGQDPGCFFRDRLNIWGMPIVHSVFADQVDRRVIITGVRRPTKDFSWYTETFDCEFYPPGRMPKTNDSAAAAPNVIIVSSDPILKDEHKVGAQPQGVLIITCDLPAILHGVDVFKMNLRRRISSSLSYFNITVCRAMPTHFQTHYLSMCTMLKSMDMYVPDWLEYHKRLGVERVYIYDNDKYSTLASAPGVKPNLDSGFLTIIPWSHEYSEGKTYLETQIASENDCLWRHRHDATWVIKTDVDEFLQPMDPQLPTWLPAYLNQSLLQNLAAVRLQNWFFCQYDKKIKRHIRRKAGGRGDTVFERNQYSARVPTRINKGRDKVIVRPDRVHYFKIHAIKLGGDILTLDPYNEIRMVHYRGDNPRHPTFCPKIVLNDTSMLDLWNSFHNNSKLK